MNVLDVYFTKVNRYYACWRRTVLLYIYTLLRYRHDFKLFLGKRWVPVDIPITTLKPEHSGKRGRNVASGNIDVVRDGKLIGNL